MTAPVALVTGASGQDGSYLVERLVAEGYAVHATVRSPESAGVVPVGAERTHVTDLANHAGLRRLVNEVAPDEIYHLGGVTSVAESWLDPMHTAAVTGMSALALLDAAWQLQQATDRDIRFVLASSAEVFGEPECSPQDEDTPIRPVTPYGAVKAFAQHCVDVHRAKGLAASSLILYNHESPRRPTTFVTRKITSAAARIARDGGGTLTLGNLSSRRDWGWAPDYVDAMVRAGRGVPGTYVIATGVAHSVADFVAAAFARVGISEWEEHVRVDESLLRPADPTVLAGNPAAARRALGWTPTHTFDEVVAAMVDADLALLDDRP